MIRSGVVDLLLACRPPTIVRGVIAIVVNSVDAVLARWSLAHVFKKILEGMPSLANGYASSAVIEILGMVGIRASISYSSPRIVGWRIAHSVRLCLFERILCLVERGA